MMLPHFLLLVLLVLSYVHTNSAYDDRECDQCLLMNCTFCKPKDGFNEIDPICVCSSEGCGTLSGSTVAIDNISDCQIETDAGAATVGLLMLLSLCLCCGCAVFGCVTAFNYCVNNNNSTARFSSQHHGYAPTPIATIVEMTETKA